MSATKRRANAIQVVDDTHVSTSIICKVKILSKFQETPKSALGPKLAQKSANLTIIKTKEKLTGEKLTVRNARVAEISDASDEFPKKRPKIYMDDKGDTR